jgi:hypothetical protein
MAGVVAAERKGVGEYRGTARGGERSLQRHRLIHVPAARPPRFTRTLGGDGPVFDPALDEQAVTG